MLEHLMLSPEEAEAMKVTLAQQVKVLAALIGKYLSRLRKLDHAIVLKVGFEP
jgi:hypothetical protein